MLTKLAQNKSKSV